MLLMTSTHILVGDRVYSSWQDSDQWYYGSVFAVSNVDGSDRFDVRFDDGTAECGITRDCIQFISRPDVRVEVNGDCVVKEDDSLIQILTVGDSSTKVDDIEADELWEL